MTHLSPDEFIDAVEETLPDARRAHLLACDVCGAEDRRLKAALREARAVTVPEPSPLFWEHLSRRVRESIDGEPQRDTATPPAFRWFDWRVLAPVASLCLLLVALTSAVSNGISLEPTEFVAQSARAGGGGADLEARWTAMLDELNDDDVNAAIDDGLIGHPWSADGAISQLTSSEQQELLRLLDEELR